MALATFLSTASTHNVFRGDGTYYGMSVSPAAGGTVILADLADAGAPGLNLNAPAGISGIFEAYGVFPASPPPATLDGHGLGISDGLTLAFSSTMKITVYYHD